MKKKRLRVDCASSSVRGAYCMQLAYQRDVRCFLQNVYSGLTVMFSFASQIIIFCNKVNIDQNKETRTYLLLQKIYCGFEHCLLIFDFARKERGFDSSSKVIQARSNLIQFPLEEAVNKNKNIKPPKQDYISFSDSVARWLYFHPLFNSTSQRYASNESPLKNVNFCPSCGRLEFELF